MITLWPCQKVKVKYIGRQKLEGSRLYNRVKFEKCGLKDGLEISDGMFGDESKRTKSNHYITVIIDMRQKLRNLGTYAEWNLKPTFLGMFLVHRCTLEGTQYWHKTKFSRVRGSCKITNFRIFFVFSTKLPDGYVIIDRKQTIQCISYMSAPETCIIQTTVRW